MARYKLTTDVATQTKFEQAIKLELVGETFFESCYAFIWLLQPQPHDDGYHTALVAQPSFGAAGVRNPYQLF